MKQLLKCSSDNDGGTAAAAVVALNDHAYYCSFESSEKDANIMELKALPSKRTDLTENPIQAVAIQRVDNHYWCAVSRMDKTLALYNVNNESKKTEGSTDDSAITPTIVHETSKRVGCMCFAKVPSGSDNNNSNDEMLVMLAGDYTGDAWALSLQKPNQMRLLLGHTASMLTGIQCIGDNTKLLTSDRDEKIRVTQFPNTVIIDGFLLGHEAYVSCMDVCHAINMCVSCSGGDGTVKVWDYNNNRMEELVSWCANADKNSEQLADKSQLSGNEYARKAQIGDSESESGSKNDKTQNDKKRKAEDEKDDYNGQTSTIRVPARVAINNNGSTIAVIYDNCKTVDILRFRQGEKTHDQQPCSLARMQSMECPDQPLSIHFANSSTLMVLMKDPTYLQVFHHCNDTGCIQPMKDHPLSLLLRNNASTTTIRIPDSVLEKDKRGNPTMQKLIETRGGAAQPEEQKPWNRAERVDIAKERNRRHNKRRRKRLGGGGENTSDEEEEEG